MEEKNNLFIVAGSIIGILAGGLPGALIGGAIGAILKEATCPRCNTVMRDKGTYRECPNCKYVEMKK